MKEAYGRNELLATDMSCTSRDGVLCRLSIGEYEHRLAPCTWITGQRNPASEGRLAAGELRLDMQFIR